MPPPKFQAYTIKSTGGRLDRLITDVQVMESFDPAHPPAVTPPAAQTKALWDTGATRSVVSAGVVKALQLPNAGLTEIRHAGGSHFTQTHMINLLLPNGAGFVGILASEFPDSVGPFGVIIGMDVLTMGDFALTNLNGVTCMSFRTPSMVTIDYVAEHNRASLSGVGRNDLCPCGSKKKYKKCHGANV